MMPAAVSQDRLTRQELSWLLAQEARGAAKALREGVAQLTQPPPGPVATPMVETNLDALDEAISKLSALQQSTTATKARRGRIDLAALLCEVAPNARIAMEPGAGTEVFGEESELRRMLHLLVSQTNSTLSDSETARSDVVIKRENQWVRISVELGPDSSATAETERRWLSRMATRHGGRLELEGGTEALLIPADRAGDEVAELRRELEQAQQLGEAYARELAAVFAQSEPGTEKVPASQLPPAGSERLELLISTASTLVRTMRGWLEATASDMSAVGEALGGEHALTQRLTKRLSAAQELFAELERLAACPLTESGKLCDLATELRTLAAAAEPRAARHGVALELEAPDTLKQTTRVGVFSLMARSLIDHAIAATPRGGKVGVRLAGLSMGFELRVEDGGPAVPAPSRTDLVRRRIDPTAVGRPEGLALAIADAAAPILGMSLYIGETADGCSEIVVGL